MTTEASETVTHFSREITRIANDQQAILDLAPTLIEKHKDFDAIRERATRSVKLIHADATPDQIDLFARVADGLADHDPDNDESNERIFSYLAEAFESLNDWQTAEPFLESVLKEQVHRPQVPRLLAALLVQLVSDLEVSFRAIAVEFYRLRPFALHDDQTSYTLEQLSHYDSLEELREEVTRRRIDSLTRGSYKDWLRFFNKKMGLRLNSEIDKSAYHELFERRNCHVHHSGLATAAYEKHFRDEEFETSEGASLEVTIDYLRSAADHILILVLEVCVQAERQYGTERSIFETNSILIDEGSYKTLLSRRLRVCEKVFTLFAKDLPSRHESILRVNRWLALQQADPEDNQILQEVRSWDPGEEAMFRMVRHALLGEHLEAKELLTSLLEDDPGWLSMFLTWPVFAPVRDSMKREGEGIATLLPSRIAEPPSVSRLDELPTAQEDT